MISPFLALTAPSPPHPFLSLPKHTKASKMCLVKEKDGNKIKESFQVLSWCRQHLLSHAVCSHFLIINIYYLCNQGEEKGPNITKLGSKGVSGISSSSCLAWGQGNSSLTHPRLEFLPQSVKYHCLSSSLLHLMINSGLAVTWLTWDDFTLRACLRRQAGLRVEAASGETTQQSCYQRLNAFVLLRLDLCMFFCGFYSWRRQGCLIEASWKWLNFNGI